MSKQMSDTELLKGAQKALRKALPFLPADKEAVFCGEWLSAINDALKVGTNEGHLLNALQLWQRCYDTREDCDYDAQEEAYETARAAIAKAQA